MKILITGGAGFLGSVITPYLLGLGHHVTVIDTLVHGVPSLLGCAHYPRFEFIKGDARSLQVIKEPLAQADAVIPLAAIVGAPACDADVHGTHSINFGAVSLICSHLSPAQRIFYPNTNSGYGTTAPGTICDENTPLIPISLYGKTKTMAEKLVLERENSVVFRLATVFGVSPRMRFDLLFNDFVLRAHRDGCIALFEASARRNFVHIRDVASAFSMAVDETIKPGVYNCGNTSMNMTKLDLCEAIVKVMPAFDWFFMDHRDDPDKRDYAVSNERLEAAGWKATYGAQEGIEQVLTACKMLPRGAMANV